MYLLYNCDCVSNIYVSRERKNERKSREKCKNVGKGCTMWDDSYIFPFSKFFIKRLLL